MNKEYKFRVWNNEAKIWASPNILEICDGKLLPTIDADNFIIQQYTGLKDKNNKEIYDGDIVKVARCHIKDIEEKSGVFRCELIEDGIEIGNIFWSDVCFQWLVSFEHIRYDDTTDLIYNPDRYEIIGNIFENSELVS